MARPDKVEKVEEVRRDLSEANATLLTHYRGLSVTAISELRVKLREADAELKVVKNTLTRRAAREAGIEGFDELLVGPTALVLCGTDPVGPAKALKEFAKDHPELVVRGGYFDGDILDETEAIRLADLESREDLLAKLVGLLNGALVNTVRLVNAPLEQQARLLQALVDAGGAPGAPTSEPSTEDAGDAAAGGDEAAAQTPDQSSADDGDAAAEATEDPKAAAGDTEGDATTDGDGDAAAEDSAEDGAEESNA